MLYEEPKAATLQAGADKKKEETQKRNCSRACGKVEALRGTNPSKSSSSSFPQLREPWRAVPARARRLVALARCENVACWGMTYPCAFVEEVGGKINVPHVPARLFSPPKKPAHQQKRRNRSWQGSCDLPLRRRMRYPLRHKTVWTRLRSFLSF